MKLQGARDGWSEQVTVTQHVGGRGWGQRSDIVLGWGLVLAYVPVRQEDVLTVRGALGATDVGVRIPPLQQVHFPALWGGGQMACLHHCCIVLDDKGSKSYF